MPHHEPTRPSDEALLRQIARTLAARSGLRIVMAGLVDTEALTITELVGTRTHSLRRLFVQPGEGVGGGAIASGSPTVVADYVSSAHISHQHDQAVRHEGLRGMIAAPAIVDGTPRAVIYAATRESTTLGGRAVNEVVRATRAVAAELRTRDEVDRRMSVLRGTEPEAVAGDRALRETMRAAHAELVALASVTDDRELAEKILQVTSRLAGSPPATPAGVTPLTRREQDVLAQVALGCAYPEVARRLGIRPGTVKGYMQLVMHKLGAHSRHEAIVAARRLGLLP